MRDNEKNYLEKSMKQKELQFINLAPVSPSIIEKLVEMHPMKTIIYATIVQVVVFFGMLGTFKLIELVVI
jgi:hypothetical protein